MLPAIQNPSLTAFKPRSVMLSNQAMNNLSNKTSKTLNPCQKKTLLHSSILHYLQRSGFSKTLKYFQREAPLEVKMSANIHFVMLAFFFLRLDGFMCFFFCSSESSPQPNGSKNSESGRDAQFQLGIIEPLLEHPFKLMTMERLLTDLEEVYYRVWKHVVELLHYAVIMLAQIGTTARSKVYSYLNYDLEKSDKKDEEDNCVAVVETVSKKKKKRSEESNRKAVVNESGTANKFCNAKNSEKTLTKDIVPPLNVKSKEKKSKKISDPLDEGTEQVSSEISKEPVDETVCELQLDESSKKGKDKKKKSKLVSQSLVDNAEPHQLDTQPGENEENPKGLAAAEGREATDSEANIKSKDKKKKKLEKKNRKGLIQNPPADKVVVEESKRQKTESSKESDGIKLLKEVKESLGSDLDKGDKGKVALNKSQETPIKQLDVQANGILDKNGEKSTERKQVKNQQNSTEFCVFTLPLVYSLQGGADSGYGAKAQEILGQVRGR
ncbi:hypothetical protein CK203_108396 [Vitis vinifera]|uniref:PAC1-like LisH-like dimerisation domain-containing protein n=1 Tax=Vitis vinifera TaxID=29760 RepID=A0A438CY73_VITVI|nr:hypothetical protein CK203_108396 [Vitis vinifera]